MTHFKNKYSFLHYSIVAFLAACLLGALSLMLSFKTDNSVKAYDSTGTNKFSAALLRHELLKYRVKHVDVAMAQFYIETGYSTGVCSDILCLGNNLFAMKAAHVRPSTYAGEFEPNGGGKYAYYDNWRESVIDYALYQSHYINSKMTKYDWINFLAKRYAKTKGYGRLICRVIKSKKL